jgi:hypothetical protein
LTISSKSSFGAGWSSRVMVSEPVQMSCWLPSGRLTSAWLPLAPRVTSPTGSTSVQRFMSTEAPLNSSDCMSTGQAAVVKVRSLLLPTLFAASFERTW